MKTGALCICVILFKLALANLQADMTHIKACNETSPISLQTMNNLLMNKKFDTEPTNNFKCFLHCLFVKYKWMDEEGGFLLHEMKTVFDETDLEISSLEFVLYKCTAIDSIDKCERAIRFIKCFWERVSESPPEEDQFLYNLTDEK